jgi:hypothetical protein
MALVGVVAEWVVGERWLEVVVGAAVGGPWARLGLDNLAGEAASQEDSLGWDIGSPEEGICVVEEDGIRLARRTEAEDIDSYHTPVVEVDIDALEGTPEIAASVVEEQ